MARVSLTVPAASAADETATGNAPPVVAAMVSKHTCFATTGLTFRQLRRILRTRPEVRRFKAGKLILVPVADLVALARPATGDSAAELATAEHDDSEDDADGETEDEILRSLGFRRVSGARVAP